MEVNNKLSASQRQENNAFAQVEKLNGTGKYTGAGPSNWQIFCMSSLPELSKLMGYGLLEDDVLQFFAKICKKQLELRQMPNAVRRGDFLDVMIAGLHAPLWSGK